MTIIGIDVGEKGGVGSIKDGHAATVKMPTERSVIRDTLAALVHCPDVFVLIEKQGPRTVVTKAGSRIFCKGSHQLVGDYHYLLGLLDAWRVRYEIVSPKAWQKRMLCDLPKTDYAGRKRQSKERAEQLFRLGKMTDGESDALLIAEDGRRRWAGTEIIAEKNPKLSNKAAAELQELIA